MDLGLEDRRKEESAGQGGALTERRAAARDREAQGGGGGRESWICARGGDGGHEVLGLCIHKLKCTQVHFSAAVYTVFIYYTWVHSI